MCHLQELWTRYKTKGLVILGFDTSDEKKIALDMLRENGATFPNVIDSSDAAEKVSFEGYRCTGMPLNYIIDRGGKVVDTWYGYEEGHPRALAALTKTGGQLEEAIRQQWAATAAAVAEKITATAARLFQAVRAADYDHDWTKSGDWKWFPAKDVVYDVDHDRPGWVRWVCKKFKANPVTDVRLGKVFVGRGGAPTIHFELRLKQGHILQGDLPFRWDAEKKQWIAEEGLDWHLHAWPWDDWWDKLTPRSK